MRPLVYGVTTLALLLLCPAGTAQEKTPSTAVDPNSGSVADNVYKNEFFAFTYIFPGGWSVFDLEVLKRIDKERMAKAEQEARAQQGLGPDVKVRVIGSHTLLIVLEHPHERAPAGEVNSEIDVWADGVNPDSAATAADYLYLLRDPSAEILLRPSPSVLSGRDFVRADVRSKEGDDWVYKSSVVTIEEGYALGIDMKARSREELDKLLQTTQSLVFQNRPDSGVVSSTTYKNYFFGFRYQMPKGWNIASKELMKAMADLKKEQMKKDFLEMFGNQPVPKNVSLKFTTSYDLLAAYKLPLGEGQKGFNSSVRIWAEEDPLATTPEGYFANGRFLVDPLADVLRAPTKYKLGDKEFLRADRLARPRERWYESRIVTSQQGYILVLELTAGNKQELEDLAETAQSWVFQVPSKQ